MKDHKITLQMKKYLCIKYKVENIRNDTACNIKLKIDDILALKDFALAKMSSKILKLIFALDGFSAGEEKDIEFTYDFSNIDGTVRYRARERFTVLRTMTEAFRANNILMIS